MDRCQVEYNWLVRKVGHAGRLQVRTPAEEVVLLGAGHTHLHVLRHWRAQAPAGARLTCISSFATSTYSGMLPGVLAGQYPPSQMEVALAPLCRASGATLIVDDVHAVNVAARRVILSDGSLVPFDRLSVGVGSVPRLDTLQIADSARVVSIKPMQTFLPRLRRCVEQIGPSHGPRAVRFVVVGGGAGGVEIALCAAAFVRAVLGDQPRLERALATTSLVEGSGPGLARRVRQALDRAGVVLLEGRRAVAVRAGHVVFEGGDEVEADVVVCTTGAAPPAILATIDLPRDPSGFLLTNEFLQSTAEARVYAVGDCGTLAAAPAAKAGVYAVRQGPVLLDNLRRAVEGRPPRRFSPQSSFLRLLNTGDGRAIGEWRGRSFEGRWAWRLKDRIDRRFLAAYQVSD